MEQQELSHTAGGESHRRAKLLKTKVQIKSEKDSGEKIVTTLTGKQRLELQQSSP